MVVHLHGREEHQACDGESQLLICSKGEKKLTLPTRAQVHDVLNGLNHARWKEYVVVYKRAASARLQRMYNARKKAQIREENQQDRSLAQDLLNLAQRRPSEEAGSSVGISRGAPIATSTSSVPSSPSNLRRSKRSTAGARSKGGVGGH